jgi:hypothetical protein
MMTQEKISLASAAVAAASLLANVVLASLLYRFNRGNATLDLSLTGLKDMLHQLESTRLFEVDPEQEIWEFGFSTLKELANACPTATTAARHKRVPHRVQLQSDISDLCSHVKTLRSFQDSWRQYRSERETVDWRTLQEGWPDLVAATKALREAQPVAERCRRTLSGIARS